MKWNVLLLSRWAAAVVQHKGRIGACSTQDEDGGSESK